MKTITENNLTWVDIEKPTQKDIDWMKNNFNFHPVTLGELIPSSQREKVEHFNDYLFLVTYVPIFVEKKHTTTPIEIDFLITADKIFLADILDSPSILGSSGMTISFKFLESHSDGTRLF